MKKIFLLLNLLLSFLIINAQKQSIRFVHISDTHIGSPNGLAEEDFERTVADINSSNDIAFVVLTGDITELGTDAELRKAKEILNKLKIPWYIIPGNHDTGWSESGGQGFSYTFGYDKFSFDYSGIRFVGCASGPYVRMSDGHIPRDAVLWLDSVLAKTPDSQPIIFLNHYPLDPGLDNWYEATDRLKQKNILMAICGHGHTNKIMNFDGIPAFMGRSNLRAKEKTGGYNIVDIRNDSAFYTEHRPGTNYLKNWGAISLVKDAKRVIKISPKPDFSINEKYPSVKPAWIINSDANVISTPIYQEGLVIFGNQGGTIEAIQLSTGVSKWKMKIPGAIFSSPAAYKRNFIVGSTEGYVYSFNHRTGKEVWRHKTDAAVLGSPLVVDNVVFIGGSDHKFYALDANNGNTLWSFDSLQGPVVSKPVVYKDYLVFGAWDTYLYALNKLNGKLIWKWNNGSSIRNYSPASCIPVIANEIVYVVAPDRYISAIDLKSGKTLWRNNDATVRESVGISADGKWIYGKTMQDTIVAYPASADKQSAAWKLHCGFGYEHVPSMLIENNGLVYFGTRNGVVYCIDPDKKEINWAHKIDNSMVNTVRVLKNGSVIAATMDGKVICLSPVE